MHSHRLGRPLEHCALSSHRSLAKADGTLGFIRTPHSAIEQPTVSMSSGHLIISPRTCISPGGIFATFLKIFFLNRNTLMNNAFATRSETKDLQNPKFKSTHCLKPCKLLQLPASYCDETYRTS